MVFNSSSLLFMSIMNFNLNSCKYHGHDDDEGKKTHVNVFFHISVDGLGKRKVLTNDRIYE